MKTNVEIVRKALKENHMYQWQLAELLGVGENTIVRLFRKEISDSKRDELLKIIELSNK